MRLAVPTYSRPAADEPLRRAVFIDKDGTLVRNVPYNVDPDLLEFTPGAVDGLRRLDEAGWLLVVVSNQPGLALGRFDRAALERLSAALTGQLAMQGVPLTAFYACPHAPIPQECRCRKPAPGLLLQAARQLGIDLERSWMVGDILDDIEAGWRAGCRTVLMDVGNETEWKVSPIRTPDARVHTLAEAAEAILTAGSRKTRLAACA